MSNRRRAEVSVIEAAHQLVNTSTDGTTFYPPFSGVLWELVQAVSELEKLGLGEPTARSTGKGHPQTSHEAAESMRASVGKLAGDVFVQFLINGDAGLTADGVQARLRGTHQSISPRITELADKGWIVKTDKRRRTRSGRWADVYKVSEMGRQAASRVKEWSW